MKPGWNHIALQQRLSKYRPSSSRTQLRKHELHVLMSTTVKIPLLLHNLLPKLSIRGAGQARMLDPECLYEHMLDVGPFMLMETASTTLIVIPAPLMIELVVMDCRLRNAVHHLAGGNQRGPPRETRDASFTSKDARDTAN